MYKLSKADREYLDRLRGRYNPDVSWYGVLVHWGKERRVRDRIARDFAHDGVRELLVPETRGAIERNGARRDLLIGGHLFLRCTMYDQLYMHVCSYPEVFKILGRAFRIPTCIDEEEMRIFKEILNTFPAPQLVDKGSVGTRATVVEGLMKGLQGHVVEVNAQYIKLDTRFSFLDDANRIIVSVPRHQVRIELDGSSRSPIT